MNIFKWLSGDGPVVEGPNFIITPNDMRGAGNPQASTGGLPLSSAYSTGSLDVAEKKPQKKSKKVNHL